MTTAAPTSHNTPPQAPIPAAQNPTNEPLRVVLFTDTLGDVNGVSRFIQNIATNAHNAGLELHAVTSTRFTCPPQPNIHNLKPIYTRPMPGYATLDIVIPPASNIRKLATSLNPHVVHVSTPGPVGLAGWRWARKNNIPILGTYHTDFPAYINHLFDDQAMTWITAKWMSWFYKPMRRVFSRSADYAQSLIDLGVKPHNIVKLLPGIDTDTFHTKHRDPAIWSNYQGVRPNAVKLLYVGRISVEKNLPMLADTWPAIRAACTARGTDAQLIIVGDGPYKQTMQEKLTPHAAVFLGFRHGQELSTIYASADAFAFPSTTDTLGQVVMEAQSAGLPVIVTDQGGPGEVVDHNTTGYVLPATNKPRWINTITDLLCDPTRRKTMGEAAHAKIQPMSIAHSFQHFWNVHEEESKR